MNSIIHADYEGRTSLQIVKSREGFILRNPGMLRLSVEEIRQGGRSDCRNRTLQRMLALLGFGEQAGSGFSRILRAWREQHWVEPLIADDMSGDFSVLRLSNASLISNEVTERMQQLFGDRFNRLEENGRLAVATAEAEGRVTNARLQEITTVHARDLTLLLRRLVDGGFLEAHGDRRGAWYTVGLSQTPSQSSTSLSQSSRPSLSQSRGLEAAGFDNSQQLPTQSSPQSLSQSSRSLSQTDPVANQRWSHREQVESAILELCRGRFVPIHELATSLARSSKTIRQNYIPRLVADGRLELRDPNNPTVPDQAYRTVEHAQ